MCPFACVLQAKGVCRFFQAGGKEFSGGVCHRIFRTSCGRVYGGGGAGSVGYDENVATLCAGAGGKGIALGIAARRPGPDAVETGGGGYVGTLWLVGYAGCAGGIGGRMRIPLYRRAFCEARLGSRADD